MIRFHDLTLEQFIQWCQERGEKSFRAEQVWEWVYQKGVSDWALMTNLSKEFRSLLEQSFQLKSLRLDSQEISKDQQTVKFLWKLEDGKFVESVLILAPGRKTVCVSSQVGCPARCAFCASGKEGLMRNLTAVEIFEQVYQIQIEIQEKVSHIVFMGMGEPLENYDEVVKALKMLCDENRLHFSERKITVSTVGVVEGIHKLAQESFKVNLALSLHAPNQHVRKKIIPYARKYDLSLVLEAMRQYAATTKRDITYEYTLLAGINDHAEHAMELAKLVQGDPCTVNLIPYNPVDGINLERPEREQIEEFREILEAKGIVTTWRYTKGKDIAAACGQLALKKKSESDLHVLPML
ncbi:MAG: 23S rRNA (adenine(2503)-C(2))-methyltransferase RlmN [Rhabdochlamydiaceae bacterium]|nr:23S rRNA (adenine(2503)-C(2))-methyltransferase RlmN [Rhabdochlamydiaceae bacterium]